MEIVDLHYLAASADAGNFARAAQSLGLNTSTNSRRIGRLEAELGLALFERSPSGVRLTAAGAAVMRHVRRALAEFDAVKSAGRRNGSGAIGEIHLGVRLPPIGEPVRSLLKTWRKRHPEIELVVSELNDRDIAGALEERRLDVALVPSFTLWPRVAAIPLYDERIVAALPAGHPLTARETLDWVALAAETILVQGWEESQVQREFFARFLGSGARFRAHAASKQSVFALVAAGFGATLAAASQSEVTFPDVVFRPIGEPDASFRVDLAWLPETEEPAVGRFVAFMRDEARSRQLL
jgi:DNA-binding transcriptional LysR family regulator